MDQLIEDTPSTAHDIPLVTSLCYYAITMLLCRLLRSAVIKTCTDDNYRHHWLCVVGAFQTLSCSFENGNVRKHYGNVGYAIALVLVATWHCMTCASGTSGNPCNPVERYASGRYRAKTMCIHLVLQMVAARLSFTYARLFWSLHLSAEHIARSTQTVCSSDLTVSLWLGFVIEFCATLLMRTLSLMRLTSYATFEDVAKRFVDAWVTLLGLRLTGMYMNPLNASNQTFGCRGSSLLQHLSVYWVAPLAAAVTAVAAIRFSGVTRSVTSSWVGAERTNVARADDTMNNAQYGKMKLQ